LTFVQYTILIALGQHSKTRNGLFTTTRQIFWDI